MTNKPARKNTFDRLGDFAKNKIVMLGIFAGSMLMGMDSFGQSNGNTKLKIAPATPTTQQAPSVYQKLPAIQKAIEQKKKERAILYYGADVFEIGGVFSKDKLFNEGVKFNWNGKISPGKPASWIHNHTAIGGGYTLRRKSFERDYEFTTPQGQIIGHQSYRPTEVNLTGYYYPMTFAQPSKNDEHAYSSLVRPYFSFEGTGGRGQAVNPMETLSLGLNGGVQIYVFGKNPKLDNVDGELRQNATNATFSFFAEAGVQILNRNRYYYGGYGGSYFNLPPNDLSRPNFGFRVGAHVAIFPILGKN